MLTADRWDDLAQLFSPSGADGGCWCMYWRFTQKEYAESSREKNQQALRDRVQAGRVPGLLAYSGGQAIGWCGVSPRADFARLQHSRHFPAVDIEGVWSIVCFFIHRDHRGQKTASRLLRAAVAYAFKLGAVAVEGYPIQAWPVSLTSAAAFPGTVAMFRQAGFSEVAATPAKSGGQFRSIMRCEVPPQ